ncbi:hypothetical protein RFI_17749, partial [Reticulomyxa filosa]
MSDPKQTSSANKSKTKDDETEGTASKGFNFNPKIFEMTHSPIMAPFMVHCVLELLNKEYGKTVYNPQTIIQFWCGGLSKIMKCLENCKPTWTELVKEVVDKELISLTTPMWTNALIQIYRTDPSSLDFRKRLEVLVGRWINAGVAKGMPGPYPSNVEQDCFLGVIGDDISGALCMYIAEGKFSEVYSFDIDDNEKNTNEKTQQQDNQEKKEQAPS